MAPEGKSISFREDEFGKKLDRCITDLIIKSTGGVLLGSAMSLLFLKRKAWPIILGAGFGGGVAYRTCEKDINTH